MDQKKNQFSVFLLINMSIILIIFKTSAQNIKCSTTLMFANNSDYGPKLNTLFRYLSSNATNPNGYYRAEVSNRKTSNEVVYGHFLCRGDQNTSSCKDCVTKATTTDLPKNCPNQKEAILWYDNCMVRYSNHSFFGKMETKPTVDYANVHTATGNNVTRFEELVAKMMHEVIAVNAANGGSQKKFATDFVNYTRFQTIYGLGQCTPDLSPGDCNTCLEDGIQTFKMDRQGCQALQPSCNIRYEISPFFELSSLAPPPQPLSLPPQQFDSTHTSGKKIQPKVILAIVVPVVIFAMALLIFGICCMRQKKHQSNTIFDNGEDFSNDQSLQYDLATLQSATNDFSDENKLGEGGFGGVYKATLPNGQQVAVKRLSMTSSQGVQQFKNEVVLVAKLQHRNLVRLLGFCLEGLEKLLVYDYVPNKSLDNFLFDNVDCRGLLSWGTRYKLIGGIARGMLYLHHDSQLKIIHRDLKASNVLLDVDMNPKISDFGMAKIFGVDETQGNTSRVVGTYGYMAPEYAMQGQFSNKSDVYSFGVLVLEIISGKRNNAFYQSGEAEDLLSYAWKQWRDGMAMEFVDPVIRDSCSNEEVMKCLHLGLLCVQESPNDRPTMATIALTFESCSVTLPVPEAPGFFVKSRMKESNFTKEVGSDQSTHWSMNRVSITEPEPR